LPEGSKLKPIKVAISNGNLARLERKDFMNRLRMLLILTALMTAGSALASAEEFHGDGGPAYRYQDRNQNRDRDDRRYFVRDRDDRFQSFRRNDGWRNDGGQRHDDQRGRYYSHDRR
jgi:hypothetical protein